jgi:hypothetical protein
VEDERGDGPGRLLCALAREERLPTSLRAPKEAAEPERKNLAVEPVTGALDGRAVRPGRRSGRQGRAEIDLLEPEDETFAKRLAEKEQVAPSAPPD